MSENGDKKTGVMSSVLIWFGAAVSIAEIATGTMIAPLGFVNGVCAILLGHVIGCALFFLAGLIGAETGKSAMETTAISFGSTGARFFAAANVVQLIGWTAVMIATGAQAASTAINSQNAFLNGATLWSCVIALLIIVWILAGVSNISKLNAVSMTALFFLTVVLSRVVFRSGISGASSVGVLSFGEATELSAAMPISWLPLISDYTRDAKKPFAATISSTLVYFLISCWMYIIGLGAALFAGSSDIAAIMVKAGLGAAAIIIVVISTVTTTFLDAYSAGVSFLSIAPKVNQKITAAAACVAGAILAIFTPVARFENFLYFIGSVFAPMIAILIADFFILKNDFSDKKINVKNAILWIVGFIIYRLFMNINTPLGCTLPAMLIVFALSVCIEYASLKFYRAAKKSVDRSGGDRSAD